jgi:hypothetical protein
MIALSRPEEARRRERRVAGEKTAKEKCTEAIENKQSGEIVRFAPQ